MKSLKVVILAVQLCAKVKVLVLDIFSLQIMIQYDVIPKSDDI
jgi:hypothetical protein